MKRLIRSRHERVISGVCGGFSEYFNLDPALIRLVWIFFTLFGGSGILAYILAMIIIPDEYSSRDEKPVQNKNLRRSTPLWGAVLIVVGFILFLQHGHVIRIIFHSFWGAGINVVLALGLIGVGIYLVYSRKSDVKSVFDSEFTTGLHISETDKKIFGVCGGIAESLQIDPTIVRFIWVFATFMSVGIGIVLYGVLALILPKSSSRRED